MKAFLLRVVLVFGALLLLLVVFLAGVLGWGWIRRFDGLASGVTVEAIREVKEGMTISEVLNILGPPLEEGPFPDDFTGRINGYTKPLQLFYPRLWISLENGRVTDVYAKLYDPIDDTGVYMVHRMADAFEMRRASLQTASGKGRN